MVLMKSLMMAAVMLATAGTGMAQQAPAESAAKAKPVKPAVSKSENTAPATAPATTASGAPSQQVAETFLKRMFGYNENVAFHVSDIKPSGAQGISEVTAVVNTPQG